MTTHTPPRRRSRLLVAAGAAATLSLLTPLLWARPAAASVPGLIRVSAATGSDSSDSKNVTATCPPASPLLLSAGYSINGGLGDVIADDLQLHTGSVTVVAYEADPDYLPSWSLTAYAVCANKIAGHGLVTAEARFESPTLARLTLTCPSDEVLLGAGFVINGATGEVEIDYQVPGGGPSTAPTSVLTGAYEADPYGADWWLSDQAICADPLPGLVRRTADSGPNVATDFQTATASCPAGEVLVGSGWDLLGAATGEVIVDDVELNGTPATPPTSVEVDAYREDGFAGTWSVQAYALCATG